MRTQTDLTIHQLRVFEAVIRHGSFSRAAIAISVPQPSVSRIITRLEQQVGARLLLRSGAGVSLTASGERFQFHAREILQHHDSTLADIKDLQGILIGEVRLAAPESVGNLLFAPLVRSFKTAHPQADLRAISAQSAAIPSALDNESVDIGIIANTHPHPPRHAEALFTEAFYLIGPSGATETQYPTVTLQRVAEMPLILNAMPGGFRSVIDAAFATCNVTPKVKFEIDANLPLLNLIASGEGFSILPYSLIATPTTSIPLSASRIVEPELSRTLSLMLSADRAITPAMREAARHIKITIKDLAKSAKWMIL